jgi:hypothetical protein
MNDALLQFPANGNAKTSTADISALSGNAVVQLLAGLASLPSIVRLLENQQEQIAALQRELRERDAARQASDADGWMDTKRARAYLSDMSAATFDKYRYQTKVKIKGSRLDGKTLYKKSDLDNFVRLYEVASNPLA